MRAVVRGDAARAHLPGVDVVQGDIGNPLDASSAVVGAAAVVHLVGIIVETTGATFQGVHTEGTRNVVSAMSERKIPRLVHMSALGARGGIDTHYLRTKGDAEQIVMRSGLAYTVFRPSLIHGPGGEFTRMVARMVRSFLPVPVIGDGLYRLQPVYVKDVARVFADAALNGTGVGESFDVGGPETYTYDGLLDAFGMALKGHRPSKIHLPVSLMRLAARVLEALAPVPPVTRDQITMLLAGSTCDTTPLVQRFGIALTSLGAALERYAPEITA